MQICKCEVAEVVSLANSGRKLTRSIKSHEIDKNIIFKNLMICLQVLLWVSLEVT